MKIGKKWLGFVIFQNGRKNSGDKSISNSQGILPMNSKLMFNGATTVVLFGILASIFVGAFSGALLAGFVAIVGGIFLGGFFGAFDMSLVGTFNKTGAILGLVAGILFGSLIAAALLVLDINLKGDTVFWASSLLFFFLSMAILNAHDTIETSKIVFLNKNDEGK